jgi:Spy/CpxP family protein refolding chaperone
MEVLAMVRRHRYALIGALVVALAGAGAWLHAQGPGPGGRRGGPGAGMVGRGGLEGLPLGALDLTDAQREQVRQLVQQFRTQTEPYRERMRQAMDARRDASLASPPDEGRIRAAMQDLAQVQADMAVQQAQLRSSILALLTPEQQQKAQELRAEREARMQQRQQRVQERRRQQGAPTAPAQ